MEEQKNPIIEMTDNEGNRVNAELFDIFEFENQKYALLKPVVEEGEEEGDQMIAVMRLMMDGEDYFIEEIATDEEWERVQNLLNSPCDCHCGEGEGGCSCGEEKKEGCCGQGNGNCGCKNN